MRKFDINHPALAKELEKEQEREGKLISKCYPQKTLD